MCEALGIDVIIIFLIQSLLKLLKQFTIILVPQEKGDQLIPERHESSLLVFQKTYQGVVKDIYIRVKKIIFDLN